MQLFLRQQFKIITVARHYAAASTLSFQVKKNQETEAAKGGAHVRQDT